MLLSQSGVFSLPGFLELLCKFYPVQEFLLFLGGYLALVHVEGIRQGQVDKVPRASASASLGRCGSILDSTTLNVAVVGPISVTWPRTMTPLGMSSWSQWVFLTITGELILRVLSSPGRVSLKIALSSVDCSMIPMGMIMLLPLVLAGIIRARAEFRWSLKGMILEKEKGRLEKTDLWWNLVGYWISVAWVRISDVDYSGPPSSGTRRRSE